jgi:hypothetical protein
MAAPAPGEHEVAVMAGHVGPHRRAGRPLQAERTDPGRHRYGHRVNGRSTTWTVTADRAQGQPAAGPVGDRRSGQTGPRYPRRPVRLGHRPLPRQCHRLGQAGSRPTGRESFAKVSWRVNLPGLIPCCWSRACGWLPGYRCSRPGSMLETANSTQAERPTPTISTSPMRISASVSHRDVRRAMVTVVRVKTAAIRIESTFSRRSVTLRPSPRVSGPGGPEGREVSVNSPPALAAAANSMAANSMATNSRPLPKNTVAKYRSSRWPIRSPEHADEPQGNDPGQRRRPGCPQRTPGLQPPLNHAVLGHRPPPSAGVRSTAS